MGAIECQLCTKVVTSRFEIEAQRWAVWHVFYEHYDVWVMQVGPRDPIDPHPDEGKIKVFE
jgi:hypothetical protein